MKNEIIDKMNADNLNWYIDPSDKTIYFHTNKDPNGEGVDLYKTNFCYFNPGTTILVGCNGYGKSTLLKCIWKNIEDDKTIGSYYFDNVKQGGVVMTDHMMKYSKIDYRIAARRLFSSEGENIYNSFYEIVNQLSEKVNAARKSNIDIFVVLLDGIDSGLSIDTIKQIKQEVLRFIPAAEMEMHGVNMYIIATANDYAMTTEQTCYDPVEGINVSFKDYNEYEKYIMNTSYSKEKRDEKIHDAKERGRDKTWADFDRNKKSD